MCFISQCAVYNRRILSPIESLKHLAKTTNCLPDKNQLPLDKNAGTPDALDMWLVRFFSCVEQIYMVMLNI